MANHIHPRISHSKCEAMIIHKQPVPHWKHLICPR